MTKSCRKIVTSLLFFQFTANLEQSRNRIPDAQSVKLLFSLIGTFHLTKSENRTKISLTQLSVEVLFWSKNAGISKIKRALVLRGIFRVLDRGGGGNFTPQPRNKPSKSSPRLELTIIGLKENKFKIFHYFLKHLHRMKKILRLIKKQKKDTGKY